MCYTIPTNLMEAHKKYTNVKFTISDPIWQKVCDAAEEIPKRRKAILLRFLTFPCTRSDSFLFHAWMSDWNIRHCGIRRWTRRLTNASASGAAIHKLGLCAVSRRIPKKSFRCFPRWVGIYTASNSWNTPLCPQDLFPQDGFRYTTVSRQPPNYYDIAAQIWWRCIFSMWWYGRIKASAALQAPSSRTLIFLNMRR